MRILLKKRMSEMNFYTFEMFRVVLGIWYIY